jgi:AraC family transcriptional regulator
VEYIEEYLDGCPTLEEMAAVARLSVFHFARQFKAATGLPPYQYVILRRVERARELLRQSRDIPWPQLELSVRFHLAAAGTNLA